LKEVYSVYNILINDDVIYAFADSPSKLKKFDMPGTYSPDNDAVIEFAKSHNETLSDFKKSNCVHITTNTIQKHIDY
jgi:hypothetical protein